MIFGSLNVSDFAYESTLTWHSIVQNNTWELELVSASYGNTDLPMSVSKVLIDTSTRYVQIPGDEFKAVIGIIDELLGDCEYEYFSS